MTTACYGDRREAGRVLGELVKERVSYSECIVLALPRGGVPVGLEVARALDAPLDIFMSRKLGVPDNPELAMGAIAAGGVEVLNKALVASLGITPLQIAAIADRELAKLNRCEDLYREGRPPVDIGNKRVILVDDGLATGATMSAALTALRQQGPETLAVAVPVGARDTCDEIAREVDALICPFRPEPFGAVGFWYEDFSPTTDEVVRECLAAAAHHHAA